MVQRFVILASIVRDFGLFHWTHDVAVEMVDAVTAKCWTTSGMAAASGEVSTLGTIVASDRNPRDGVFSVDLGGEIDRGIQLV